MKTRAQIYSHEASGILRDISTYGVLTQKQILGLYPQKDEQLKNLLSYLCKQKRLFLVDGFYSLTPELPKDRDRGLEAAVTALADFMEGEASYGYAVHYHLRIPDADQLLQAVRPEPLSDGWRTGQAVHDAGVQHL